MRLRNGDFPSWTPSSAALPFIENVMTAYFSVVSSDSDADCIARLDIFYDAKTSELQIIVAIEYNWRLKPKKWPSKIHTCMQVAIKQIREVSLRCTVFVIQGIRSYFGSLTLTGIIAVSSKLAMLIVIIYALEVVYRLYFEEDKVEEGILFIASK